MQIPTRFRNVLAALLAGGCALVSASHGAITGQWDFLSGDLSARVGRPLEYLDGPGGPTAAQTTFGTTTAMGIPDIGGQPAHVMGFPISLPTMGYLVYPNAYPNGGGLLVNRGECPARRQRGSRPGIRILARAPGIGRSSAQRPTLAQQRHRYG